MYRDGLVRFATEKYNDSPSHLKKRCVHLTNYSVNSKKEGFVDAEEGEDGVGFKWSFDPLKRSVGGLKLVYLLLEGSPHLGGE